MIFKRSCIINLLFPGPELISPIISQYRIKVRINDEKKSKDQMRQNLVSAPPTYINANDNFYLNLTNPSSNPYH